MGERTGRPDRHRVARRQRPRGGHAHHGPGERSDAPQHWGRPLGHGSVHARCRPRYGGHHTGGVVAPVSVRQHAAGGAHFRRAAQGVPRAFGALLPLGGRRWARRARHRGQHGARLQLRRGERRRLHHRPPPAGGAAHHRAHVPRQDGAAHRQLHDGREQLPAGGRRRLLHAAGRPGGVRQGSRHPPAHHRRGAQGGHPRAGPVRHAQLAYRTGRGGGTGVPRTDARTGHRSEWARAGRHGARSWRARAWQYGHHGRSPAGAHHRHERFPRRAHAAVRPEQRACGRRRRALGGHPPCAARMRVPLVRTCGGGRR